jgi:capsular polysaccharide biosynthesis protein
MREYASLSLRSELRQLESVLERTDAARIELAVSQAAFKYRYSVIRPAQAPRDPEFPKANLILTMGLITSLFLAACVVVAKDLLSDRILEPWQIERQLGLPVLGVLRVG